MFWTYNAQLRFHEKRFDVKSDRWQWKISKTVYKMISRNMRNPENELVQHLNCQEQWRDMIYKAITNRKCQNKLGVGRPSTS